MRIVLSQDFSSIYQWNKKTCERQKTALTGKIFQCQLVKMPEYMQQNEEKEKGNQRRRMNSWVCWQWWDEGRLKGRMLGRDKNSRQR